MNARVPALASALPAAFVAVALAWTTPATAATATADGEFTSRGFVMPVASALAYRGKSTLDNADVIIVAISNAYFASDRMAVYHDRGRAIEKRFKDRETAVVYLELRPDGAYRGHSFYFKSGNGCGYCGGNMGVTSTVKLAGNKVVGTLKIKDTEKVADIKLDVPILSDDHGAPLPAPGGAPGEAYLAYHKAIAAGDAKALLATLSKDNGEYLEKRIAKGQSAQGVQAFANEHPTKSVRVLRGWSKGDTAVLVVEGESSILRLAGEVLLVREKGRWLVDDEMVDVQLPKN